MSELDDLRQQYTPELGGKPRGAPVICTGCGESTLEWALRRVQYTRNHNMKEHGDTKQVSIAACSTGRYCPACIRHEMETGYPFDVDLDQMRNGGRRGKA